MGFNPWWFNQVGVGFPDAGDPQCDHVMMQKPYHGKFLCRDDVGLRIAMAEEMIREALNYAPAPQYIVNEVHVYPRPYQRYSYGAGGTPRYQWKALQLSWGKVQGGGLFARSSINAAGAVVMSDNDGDGVNDRFTVTVATTVTDPDEVAIYFASADRNGVDLDETWRIRPVKVSISGGNAIITGHPSMLVKPDLNSVVNPVVLDVTVAANFVTALEVWRVYRDTTTTTTDPAQGTAMWEDPDCATPPCNVEWLPICLGARNAEVGMVSVDYSLDGANCPPSSAEPDRVSVNYLAGEPLVNGQMSRVMADAVAHLATGILPVGPCGCERSDRIVNWWRSLPSQGEENQRPITLKELDESPFGVSRGAIWAWNRIQHLRQQWSVTVR
jgi:hypothetical protein